MIVKNGPCVRPYTLILTFIHLQLLNLVYNQKRLYLFVKNGNISRQLKHITNNRTFYTVFRSLRFLGLGFCWIVQGDTRKTDSFETARPPRMLDVEK